MRTTCPKCKGPAQVERLRVSLDGGQTFVDQLLYRCTRFKEPCKATKINSQANHSNGDKP